MNLKYAQEKKIVKQFCIDEISGLMSSITHPPIEEVNEDNLNKAIENNKDETNGQLEDIKRCLEIYNIIKDW